MRHRTPHFTHVFSGDGYSAGYYSYLWSEVLDADPRRIKRVRIYRGRDRSGRRALKRRDERAEGEIPQAAPTPEMGGEGSDARPAPDGGSS